MLKWLNYLWNISDGPIIHPSNVWYDDSVFGEGWTFGDWLQPVGDNRKPRSTISDDCAATFYHYISTQLATKVAQILREDKAVQHLSGRLEEIRAAFVHEYFSLSGRLAHNDQTSYALAYLYDLVPDHRGIWPVTSQIPLWQFRSRVQNQPQRKERQSKTVWRFN